MNQQFRMGQGIDVHRFTAGDHVMLGGVRIPHTQGLLAHSDGDVALHALCDALLGAAGMGDIGRHFPDTDPTWADADSRVLLRQVVVLLAKQSFFPANIDLTIVAQAPKIAPHARHMCELISSDLGLAVSSVNVKATTSEQLGFTGRGEGIAAFAVAMITHYDDPML